MAGFHVLSGFQNAWHQWTFKKRSWNSHSVILRHKIRLVFACYHASITKLEMVACKKKKREIKIAIQPYSFGDLIHTSEGKIPPSQYSTSYEFILWSLIILFEVYEKYFLSFLNLDFSLFPFLLIVSFPATFMSMYPFVLYFDGHF